MYTMIVVGDMTKLTEIVNVYKASIISFKTYAPIYTIIPLIIILQEQTL